MGDLLERCGQIEAARSTYAGVQCLITGSRVSDDSCRIESLQINPPMLKVAHGPTYWFTSFVLWDKSELNELFVRNRSKFLGHILEQLIVLYTNQHLVQSIMNRGVGYLL